MSEGIAKKIPEVNLWTTVLDAGTVGLWLTFFICLSIAVTTVLLVRKKALYLCEVLPAIQILLTVYFPSFPLFQE